jgi:hypothetical protein
LNFEKRENGKMANERTVVKKVENAVLYSDGTIRIDNVRASYPHLAEKFVDKDGTVGKFGVVGLLPKDTHTAAKNLIKEQILKVIKDGGGDKVALDKWFLRDGDNGDKEEEAGNYVVKSSESKRPTCRKRNGEVMTVDEVESTIYGGCYVNILIRPWYQDGVKVGKGFGKRVNAGIVAVQFNRDGEPFGDGRITDDGVWDDSSDSSDDDGGL